jgi:hypothetical protein
MFPYIACWNLQILSFSIAIRHLGDDDYYLLSPFSLSLSLFLSTTPSMHWIQGFVHARQMLSHWAIPQSFVVNYFSASFMN